MKNHYETLGLPFGASAEQIRKRYRELVRRYHPDVNPSPNAKEQFLRIQEAYQVLSDPERRRHYDALLRMRLQAGGSGTRGHAATSKSPSASTARPSESKVKLEEARRAILQAEQAFLQGRLRDALYWARQATRLQPRGPKGYEIMGDVYRVQGHYDAALNAYTYALQLDPHNPDLQQKFERVVQRTQTRPAPDVRASALPILRLPAEWRLYAAQSLGWGAVVFLLGMTWGVPGRPLEGLSAWLLSGWSVNLMVYLVVAGFLVGFLMRVSQWVSALRDALPWHRQGGRLSAGSVLVGLGILCFPLTLLLYTLLTLTQGGFGPSATRTLSAVGLLTVLFAWLYPYDTLGTLVVGGNLVFGGMLSGWYLGDQLTTSP